MILPGRGTTGAYSKPSSGRRGADEAIADLAAAIKSTPDASATPKSGETMDCAAARSITPSSASTPRRGAPDFRKLRNFMGFS